MDWFLDVTVGIDYLGFIANKTPTEIITEVMRAEILKVPGTANAVLVGTFDTASQRTTITGTVTLSADPDDAELVTITIVSPETGNAIPWAAFFGIGSIAP